MSLNSIIFAHDEDIEDEPEVDPLMDISSLGSIKVEVEAFNWVKTHSSVDINLPEFPISSNSGGHIELPKHESDKNPSKSRLPREFSEINKAPEPEIHPIGNPQNELPKGRFGLDSSATKEEVINRVMSMNFHPSTLSFEDQILFYYKEFIKGDENGKENKIFCDFSYLSADAYENCEVGKALLNKAADFFGLQPIFKEKSELCDFKECVHPIDLPNSELFRSIPDPDSKSGKVRYFCPFLGCKRNVDEKEEWTGPGNKFFDQEVGLIEHFCTVHCGIIGNCPSCGHFIRGEYSLEAVKKNPHVEKCKPKFEIDITDYVLENAPKILRGETNGKIQKAKRKKKFRTKFSKISKVTNQEFGLHLEGKINQESGEKSITDTQERTVHYTIHCTSTNDTKIFYKKLKK